MGLDNVLQEIRTQGQKEESQILANAKSEADKLLAAAKAEAQEIAQRKAKEADTRIAALEREIVGASEFEARRRLLGVQRELLTDFRARVLDALSGLAKDRNDKIIKQLAERANQDVPKGTAHAGAKDLDVLAKLGFKKGEAREGSGGFVAESAEGDVLVDLRFEVLLDDAWKQIVVKTQDLFEVS